MERETPQIAEQIRRDTGRGGPLSFWGRSRNTDELTNTTIVDPAVLQLLSTVAGRPVHATRPHAGLQHTYGYLFSTILTKYGFKRDRWTESTIETGFGISPDILSPFPGDGTLLSNATWLSGQIAYRQIPRQLNRLNRFLKNKAAAELTSTDTAWTDHSRLLERVSRTQNGSRRSWTLQTDLVTFPRNRQSSLLVYSIVDHRNDRHQLITLFPVGNTARRELLQRSSAGRLQDIRLRYNASIAALDHRLFTGTCRRKTF